MIVDFSFFLVPDSVSEMGHLGVGQSVSVALFCAWIRYSGTYYFYEQFVIEGGLKTVTHTRARIIPRTSQTPNFDASVLCTINNKMHTRSVCDTTSSAHSKPDHTSRRHSTVGT